MRTGFDSENEEPLRRGGIRASEISLTNLYPNRHAFSIKNEDSEAGDTLRIPEKCQDYRYAKKTQISLDPKKYRYVGDIQGFEIQFISSKKNEAEPFLTPPRLFG